MIFDLSMVSLFPLVWDLHKGRNIPAYSSLCIHMVAAVLVSRSCHDKVQQTGVKTTRIYPLTVLEAQSPKSRCRQGWFQALRGSMSHVPLLALVVASNPQHPLVWRCTTLIPASLHVASFPEYLSVSSHGLLLRTPVTGFRASMISS